jgi:type I restriction-modification system DNA methylase subunit
MSSAQRTSAAEALKHSDYSLDSKASLWAYFVAHGLNFLKPGGRIAGILAGSFLHAEYSGVIKDLISDNFERSLVIQLGQRLFSSEGTEENTAILLAEGWKRNFNRGTLKVDFASTLLDLQNVISTMESREKKLTLLLRKRFLMPRCLRRGWLNHLECGFDARAQDSAS